MKIVYALFFLSVSLVANPTLDLLNAVRIKDFSAAQKAIAEGANLKIPYEGTDIISYVIRIANSTTDNAQRDADFLNQTHSLIKMLLNNGAQIDPLLIFDNRKLLGGYPLPLPVGKIIVVLLRHYYKHINDHVDGHTILDKFLSIPLTKREIPLLAAILSFGAQLHISYRETPEPFRIWYLLTDPCQKDFSIVIQNFQKLGSVITALAIILAINHNNFDAVKALMTLPYAKEIVSDAIYRLSKLYEGREGIQKKHFLYQVTKLMNPKIDAQIYETWNQLRSRLPLNLIKLILQELYPWITYNIIETLSTGIPESTPIDIEKLSSDARHDLLVSALQQDPVDIDFIKKLLEYPINFMDHIDHRGRPIMLAVLYELEHQRPDRAAAAADPLENVITHIRTLINDQLFPSLLQNITHYQS